MFAVSGFGPGRNAGDGTLRPVTTRWKKILSAKGIRVYRPYVGNYFTSLDMMGATLTVMKLDDELKSLFGRRSIQHGLQTERSRGMF